MRGTEVHHRRRIVWAEIGIWGAPPSTLASCQPSWIIRLPLSPQMLSRTVWSSAIPGCFSPFSRIRMRFQPQLNRGKQGHAPEQNPQPCSVPRDSVAATTQQFD
ncbi:hypothetical protein VTN96DRAFT_1603 [Rasamsonia emersonii]